MAYAATPTRVVLEGEGGVVVEAGELVPTQRLVRIVGIEVPIVVAVP
jgi:hypothetical protein